MVCGADARRVQENLCCINTAMLVLVSVDRQGLLPELLKVHSNSLCLSLSRWLADGRVATQEVVSMDVRPGFSMTNFLGLLEFWKRTSHPLCRICSYLSRFSVR
jgi:hypothetical protein